MKSLPCKSMDELIDAIRKAAAKQGGPYLSYEQFNLISDIPISRVHRYFDSWSQACQAASVRPGENSPSNLVGNYSKGKEHALEQLKRVAQILQTDVISKADFDAHATELRSATVQRMFKGWENALSAAGLQRHPSHLAPIPLDDLAAEFLAATRELGSIPTIVQMCRRSKHAKNTFTRKFGSYSQFKRQASELLLVNEAELSIDERSIFETELGALPPPASASVIAEGEDPEPGYVYLLRSGKAHKIGRTNHVERRERELKIQLPDKATRVHVIKTDDMRGIESYWHHRFRHKRLNGEFFDLSPSEVAAFKRRKFM